MTAGRPTFVDGYQHEMGIYESDDEFGELIRPFALEGMEAHEPVVFAYDPRKMELLRSWLPDSANFTYITDTAPYSNPAKALIEWRSVVEDRLAKGATRVRIAGNVPHLGYGRSYVGWDRYEAAFDRALGDLPVWAPCLYDARVTSPDVMTIAKQHHRHVLEPSGVRRSNDLFAPIRRLQDCLVPVLELLESTAPLVELLNPTPAQVRREIARLAAGILTDDARDQLVLATSEMVANALLYGTPPVYVRTWRDEQRLIVHIEDQGSGPTDPLAGLLSVDRDSASGRGLWIVHQLDIDVSLLETDNGFTVRLLAN